jgi:hypothetical protein
MRTNWLENRKSKRKCPIWLKIEKNEMRNYQLENRKSRRACPVRLKIE